MSMRMNMNMNMNTNTNTNTNMSMNTDTNTNTNTNTNMNMNMNMKRARYLARPKARSTAERCSDRLGPTRDEKPRSHERRRPASACFASVTDLSSRDPALTPWKISK